MEEEPLATIEFSHGQRVYLLGDHRWHGEDAEYVQITNSIMDTLDEKYRPNWASSVAHELAEMLAARVIQAKKNKPRLPGEMY